MLPDFKWDPDQVTVVNHQKGCRHNFHNGQEKTDIVFEWFDPVIWQRLIDYGFPRNENDKQFASKILPGLYNRTSQSQKPDLKVHNGESKPLIEFPQ